MNEVAEAAAVRNDEPELERASPWWGLGAVGAVLAAACIPLLFNPRFYFADDTQAGAYGIWVTIGRDLREGTFPFFEPSRWMAGNYVAEGQWGLFNPLVWLIGWVASGATDAVVVSTVVKLVTLAVAAGGIYLVARSYGARAPWAAAAALLTPLAGFTTYIDAASWVTSLLVWALLPWVWWGLRRTLLHGGNPLVPFVAGYLLVTVGYVHGTLMLCFVIAGVLLEGSLARLWAQTARVLAVGVALGLVAVAVYLPGVLTAPVTARSDDEILNTNFMSPDLSGLATGGTPLALPWMSGFWAPPVAAPLMYVAWILPLVVLVVPGRAWPVLRQMAAAGVLGLAATVLTFGPSDMGPLRFPARVLPYLVLVIMVVVVVLLSRASARPTRARVWAGAGLVVAGAAFAWFESPNWWKVIGLGATLAMVGVVGSLLLLRRTRTAPLVATFLVVTAAVGLAQHHYFPRSPLPDFGLPADRASYSSALSGVEGDAITVGRPSFEGDWWKDTLYANSWYLNDASVVNVYSPVAHEAYSQDLCVDPHGVVCWETAETLFETDPETGVPVADLLSLSAVQVLPRQDVPDDVDSVRRADPYRFAETPEGWTEQAGDSSSRLWVRDETLPTAGGVSWTSPGVALSDVETDERDVRFHVDAVPQGGGEVVFSRLDWPGYTFDGARQAASVRGYLLTAALDESAAGTTVTVSFTPPGWTLGLVSIGVAGAGILVWGAVEAVATRRRRTVTRSRSGAPGV